MISIAKVFSGMGNPFPVAGEGQMAKGPSAYPRKQATRLTPGLSKQFRSRGNSGVYLEFRDPGCRTLELTQCAGDGHPILLVTSL